METLPTLSEIHARHAFAFKDLRSYAQDDEVTCARLAKLLAAQTVHETIRNRYCLELYLACSTFIEELYDELCMLDRPECRRIFEAAAPKERGPNSFTADGWRTMSPETQQAIGRMVRHVLKSI